METAIYSAELAMHVFALYIANRFVNLENKEQRMKYLEGLEFNSWLICIKQFLNLLIENGLKQNKIELEQIKAIISTRVNLIFHQDDFETRNFDFQNLCNYEIKYEDEKNVFFIGHSEDLRINPGNPLNMLILPSAYKVGLVDEFLEKLKNAD